LLKFDSDDLPRLCDAGIDALAALPPPLSIAALVGDGRCGKSTLGSRLIDDRVANGVKRPNEQLIFPIGGTGAAVTDGIDMCVVPRGASAEGTLVVLDCEGGNNPSGAIRGAVDLVAMLSSTLTVQVVWGQMSEGQLLQIGQAIAARDRLLSESSHRQRLSSQRLLLVVNGCHLHYSPDHLNKTFSESHSGSAVARNELRANIKRDYDQIHFFTIPSETDATFEQQIINFRREVDEHCVPAALLGSRLSGAQVAETLKVAVAALRKTGAVPMPSVFRHVIFDHMLRPLVSRLCTDYEASLPDLTDNLYRPELTDARHDVLKAFTSETQHLAPHSDLVAEAREDLTKRIEATWQRISEQNTAIGEQDRDVSTESEMRYSHTEERVTSWKRSCWVIGKKTPQVEACSVFRVWTRTRVLKKNGQVAFTDWAPSSHSMDGGSMNFPGPASWGSVGSSPSQCGKFNSMGSVNSYVGERNCTPAAPLNNSSPKPQPSPRNSWGRADSPATSFRSNRSNSWRSPH
jgi:hypothetical protein